jgi:uncharacterized membrane protein YgcG
MEDFGYRFEDSTAAGILTLYVDLQRQYPDRFSGIIDTSNDDFLVIRSYDPQTYEFLRVYAPADGVGTIVLVEQTVQPVVEEDPYTIVSYENDTFVFTTFEASPQNLLPAGFFAGSGGGGDGSGFSGSFGSGDAGGGSSGGQDGTHDSPDSLWLESVDFIY